MTSCDGLLLCRGSTVRDQGDLCSGPCLGVKQPVIRTGGFRLGHGNCPAVEALFYDPVAVSRVRKLLNKQSPGVMGFHDVLFKSYPHVNCFLKLNGNGER